MRFQRSFIYLSFLTVLLSPLMALSKPRVIVSIPPQKGFIEALVGEAVDIQVLLQPGQNPTNFALSPRQLRELSEAEAYFSVGAPMEDFILPRIESNYPDIRIIDTSAGIRKRSLEDHSHDGDHHEHAHSHVADPHVWLSPGLVKIQLRHYSRTLKELLPELGSDIDLRASQFLSEVDLVDKELANQLKGLKGTNIFVYHPAFGYFLERYGLRQETVEIRGKQPSPQQIKRLIEHAKEQQVKVIFVQPQFRRHSAQALAKAIGGTVEIIDPLAENYLDNLRHMGETIAKSYR
ncbi:zinc ABC transporter substrate-binding protein [Opitutia bacterium ISCC 51]|nr:zinc ABC transporter substrate-binding protein [Opitutae bacterium ISCC 51]QXD27462.1 zinc ABC transporter substrate-binding protein [Opitutae bacterium ISCC 52]